MRQAPHGGGMIHELKIKEVYFDAIESGDKTFEIRFNDRGYQKGDILYLTAIDEMGCYTFKKMTLRVTFVHSGLGMSENYVVLGIKIKEIDEKMKGASR